MHAFLVDWLIVAAIWALAMIVPPLIQALHAHADFQQKLLAVEHEMQIDRTIADAVSYASEIGGDQTTVAITRLQESVPALETVDAITLIKTQRGRLRNGRN